MARTAAKSSFLVSDKLWSRIDVLIPKRKNTHRFGGGRPRRPDRDCMNGILFVLRTGCQWRALDVTGICPGSTAHDRFQEWERAGVFRQFWRTGLLEYDELKGIDWKWLSADGAMSKAPLAGKKTGPNPTDRAKCGTKRSLLTDGRGVGTGLAVGGANVNDFKLLRETIQSIPVKRPKPTRQKPQNLCLDKGYDYREVRDLTRAYHFTPHIRSRGEEAKLLKRGRGFKARRWVCERTHSWMNRFRRILIRWEKKDENYSAMIHLSLGIIALRAAGLFG
ncbi:MAG: IS5 family transposase [Tepidisphaeraceae bacterium]